MDEACLYDGDMAVTLDAEDAADCQDLLNLVGANFATEYFVFDALSGECTFFSDGARRCISENGPKYPSINEC